MKAAPYLMADGGQCRRCRDRRSISRCVSRVPALLPQQHHDPEDGHQRKLRNDPRVSEWFRALGPCAE